MIDVRVQGEDFDLGAEFVRLQRQGGGALASFVGVARDDGGVEELLLEHFPGMTEAALRRVAEEAVERWSLLGVTLVHRIGALRPGDRIVLVLTAARHRHAALESCAFLIDRLKTGAPFWKRERRGGEARWVEAREGDDEAARRWEAWP